MNKQQFSCALCNKKANSFCQKCFETYCSKECQRYHWPIHRTMCFPMPHLIPLENMTVSVHKDHTTHAQDFDQYSDTSFQRNLFKPKNKGNVKRMIDGARNSTLKPPIENRKYGYATRAQSRKMSTAASECSECSQEDVQTYYSLDHWRESEANHSSRSTQRNDTEEFSFDDVIEVVVQHFTESPTTTCWVIQQRHLHKRNKIEKSMNVHRSFMAATEANIKINEIYCVLLEGCYFRGKVLYRINFLEVLIHLIDYGRTLKIQISAMTLLTQKPSDSNGLAFQINFSTLRKMVINEVLRVQNVSTNLDGEIFVRCLEEKEIFTFSDLTKIPLPVDVPLELFCLDFSFVNIDLGYISVCQNVPEKIKSIDGIPQKISSYMSQEKDVTGYRPETNELCLAYVEDEGQWYRAKCITELLSNSFKLLMIDYGAVHSVKCENIRKMVNDFMQPSILHLCAIRGLHTHTWRLHNLTIEKIISYFKQNPIFSIERAIMSGGMYIIHIPELLKVIGYE